MRKIIALLVASALVSIFCGCTVNPMLLNEEAVCDSQMEAFLDALESQNTEKISELFAPNALYEANDFVLTVDDLYSYYQGEYTAYDNGGAGRSSSFYEEGRTVKELFGSYDVTTSAGDYRFAFRYVAVDTSDENNVGLWSVYIIKMVDDTDPEYAYVGDDNYTPGIQIGIPNKIPVVEEE